MNDEKIEEEFANRVGSLGKCLEELKTNCNTIDQKVTRYLIFITKNDNRGSYCVHTHLTFSLEIERLIIETDNKILFMRNQLKEFTDWAISLNVDTRERKAADAILKAMCKEFLEVIKKYLGTKNTRNMMIWL